MSLVRDLLIRYEGKENFPYRDTMGKTTIGVGRNLTDDGISDDEIEYLLQNDINVATTVAKIICPSFATLSANRKAVLVCMAFQLGSGGLGEFKAMLDAISHKNWGTAADEILNSKWAHETPNRAQDMAHLMEAG